MKITNTRRFYLFSSHLIGNFLKFSIFSDLPILRSVKCFWGNLILDFPYEMS